MPKMFRNAEKVFGSFLYTVSKSDERAFFVLFGLYVISKMMYMIGWVEPLLKRVRVAHLVLFTLVMWGSAVYLFSIIVEWRKAWDRTRELIIIGISVFLLTGIISKLETTDSYAFIMGVYFCLMACGKSYKKILYCFLFILILCILIGQAGLKFGFTFDAAKPNREFGGHSLGILYPNNWGFIVFAIMIILWYLFLKRKLFFNLIFFWGAAIFMFKYITCYTITGMAFLFPVTTIIVEVMQAKSVSRTDDFSEKNLNEWPAKTSGNVLKRLIIALPFLFLFIMLLLCWQMDWVYDTFYKFYGTSLRSFAMRFVEGGYALKLNGVSLLGHPFRPYDSSLVEYSREIEMRIDSAFICYLIIRGIIAMAMTLGWIAFAHHRCLKEHNYRLLIISFFMLLLATMERPGLDAWFNFVLLYPLASLASGKETAKSE